MGDIILPDGAVFRFDDGAGVWRHIPDVDTANAMGLDWNGLTGVDEVPGPTGDDWPSVQAPPPPPASYPEPAPVASSAGGASSFVWGGRSWSRGDLAAFAGYLAAHGTSYSTWAGNHPAAAELLEGPPADPSREPIPKSLGEALAAYIAGGDTPEEAARAAEALRASQVSQGLSSVTPAQLLEDAKIVAKTYADAGGSPGAGLSGDGSSGGGSDPGTDRYLAGDAIALELADDYPSRHLSGVTELPAKAWQDLRDQLVHDLPYVGNHVRARGKGMRGVVASDLWSGSG